MEQNPYAPPQYDMPPGARPTEDDGFIEGGRGVEAGRGYTWLTEGWEIFKRSPGMWILICILYALFAIAVSIIPMVGQLVFALVSPIFSAGLLLGCRDLRDGREFGVGHLFEGFNRAGGLLILGVIHVGWSLALGGVGLLIGTGGVFNGRLKIDPTNPAAVSAMLVPLLLFVLVSFVLGIPITMATYYAPALVAIRGMSPAAALKNSFLGAAKNVLPFIVYCIITFLFMIPAILPCGLGLLVMIPVMIASVYAGYRDVFFMDQPASSY